MSDTFGRTVTAATGSAGGVVAAGNADGQQELVRELRHAGRGDPGVRALYATDASNYRQLPIAVVLPRDTDDVVAAVGVCRAHGVPRDARAARAAAQTYTLAEFLETRTPGWTPPKLDQPLLMHGHWHERCVLDFTAQQRLLNTTTTAVDIPANGCCGMAGAFGFEADHYDVAITVGEQALLPAVRAADPRTVVVADGFSCHEQIRQGTGRVPVHLAEVLAAGLTGEHP